MFFIDVVYLTQISNMTVLIQISKAIHYILNFISALIVHKFIYSTSIQTFVMDISIYTIVYNILIVLQSMLEYHIIMYLKTKINEKVVVEKYSPSLGDFYVDDN